MSSVIPIELFTVFSLARVFGGKGLGAKGSGVYFFYKNLHPRI